MTTHIILTVIVSVICAAPAWAGIKEGLAAHKHGDYATALKEFRPLAKRGDATAQSYLGQMYDKGQGVHRIAKKP